MNAIIGLCHFCEAHGPMPVFCSFTTDKESHTTESASTVAECNGCTSLGPDTVYVTRDEDRAIYCSRESVPNADVTAFLRQAAIRSITCEVNWNKEGGIVYFSDTKGHVLSYTFQLQDTRARGLKRWFSIVVLMKDKLLLLNIMPTLSEHMQTISKQLQQFAETVYNKEQQVCSQRALRLNTGRNDFGQTRSLRQLTGDEDIFKKLHSHFTWMLKAGALTYTETLYSSCDLLEKLKQNTQGTIFEPEACTVPSGDCITLRNLEELLGPSVFRVILYCMISGIKIKIKSINPDTSILIKGLQRLLPHADRVTNNITSTDHVNVHADICHLEETENNNFCCKWSGTLPAKCPTLMNRIEESIKNTNFNDAVLHQHVKSLLLEWLGIVRTVKAAMWSSGPKSDAVKKLKRVLGVTPQDETLINNWIQAYC